MLLTNAADAGNIRAAISLVSIYRDGKGKLIPRNPQRAQQVLDRYKSLYKPESYLREEILVKSASLHSTADYHKLAELMATTPPATHLSALTGLRYNNTNAYIFIFQGSLKDQGLYNGAMNGILTQATIRAINKLCKTSPSADRCKKRPLDGEVTRIISILVK